MAASAINLFAIIKQRERERERERDRNIVRKEKEEIFTTRRNEETIVVLFIMNYRPTSRMSD